MTLQLAGGGRVCRATVVCALMGVALFAASLARAQSDPVVFTFATVGDNRQDPTKPDQTTYINNPSPTTQGGAYYVPGTEFSGAVLLQDQLYMQNSAAWSQIQNNISAQGAQLLFFNGDMIYGYGRPILPSSWTGNPSTWGTSTGITSSYLNGLVNDTWYSDAFFEYMQYAFWRGTVSTLFNSGTYVIPVPGNHETQCSATAAPYSSSSPNPNCSTTTNGGKQAWPDNENAFRANMGDLIQDLVNNTRFSNVTGLYASSVTGLTAASAPGPNTTVCTSSGTSNACSYTAGTTANNGPINDTQQYLDYSFDLQITGTPLLLHFAIINTDPSGSDETAPSDWLAGDFAAAAARAQSGNYTIKYFVFGHKPAFTYDWNGTGTVTAAGLDTNSYTGPSSNQPNYYRNLFWHVIAQYNATYFCGHQHVPNVQAIADPTPGTTITNTPYQVVVGSGGSPFDDTMTKTVVSSTDTTYTEPTETAATDRWYAWAFVEVHASGAVTLTMSGFPDTGIGGSVYYLTKYNVPGTVFSGNLQ